MKTRNVKPRSTRARRVKPSDTKLRAVNTRRVKAPGVKTRPAASPRANAPRAYHPVIEFFLVVGILIFAAAVTSWLSVT
jgi:hypothetical protein